MEKYKTIGHRLAALFIDGIIMIPVGFIISILAVMVQMNSKFSVLLGSLSGVVSVFYYIFMHARYGQTIGKMAMSVKVLDVSERPITISQAVIRSLPQMFPVFVTASILSSNLYNSFEIGMSDGFSNIATIVLYVWFIGWSLGNIISALVTKKNRALHDFIAGTVVIRTNSDRASV